MQHAMTGISQDPLPDMLCAFAEVIVSSARRGVLYFEIMHSLVTVIFVPHNEQSLPCGFQQSCRHHRFHSSRHRFSVGIPFPPKCNEAVVDFRARCVLSRCMDTYYLSPICATRLRNCSIVSLTSQCR